MRSQVFLILLVFLVLAYENKCEEVSTAPTATTESAEETEIVNTTEKPKATKKPEQKKESEDEDQEEEDEEEEEETSTPASNTKDSSGKKKPDGIGYIKIYFRTSRKPVKKQPLKPIRFPVVRYKRNRFPRFGPLVSFLPWIPIYVERRTKQTFIYSPTGGVYILPPLINAYGRRFSVAELIASGYASLVSSGAPPKPSVDVAGLVQNAPITGTNVPSVDPTTGGFKGVIQTTIRTTHGSINPVVYNNPYGYQGYSTPGQSYYVYN